MKLPLQVQFRNMQASAAVEAEVRDRASRLERFCSDIVSCRVAIEPQQRHHHKGNMYHVRIDLKVPESELVSSRDPSNNNAHEDVYVAVRDAFDAMRRQLEDYARTRRGDVKTHAA